MNKCAHCRYSIGTVDGLFCVRWARRCSYACASYEREPGADDE